ncbi:MAG: hypothetical protein IM568_06180 [Flavobacterium sp.]|nr:hypothetical protein [Flavobacterium sp.]
MSSLEDTIVADNPVRFIDAFVNSIDLVTNGIAMVFRSHLHTIFIFLSTRTACVVSWR